MVPLGSVQKRPRQLSADAHGVCVCRRLSATLRPPDQGPLRSPRRRARILMGRRCANTQLDPPGHFQNDRDGGKIAGCRARLRAAPPRYYTKNLKRDIRLIKMRRLVATMQAATRERARHRRPHRIGTASGAVHGQIWPLPRGRTCGGYMSQADIPQPENALIAGFPRVAAAARPELRPGHRQVFVKTTPR